MKGYAKSNGIVKTWKKKDKNSKFYKLYGSEKNITKITNNWVRQLSDSCFSTILLIRMYASVELHILSSQPLLHLIFELLIFSMAWIFFGVYMDLNRGCSNFILNLLASWYYATKFIRVRIIFFYFFCWCFYYGFDFYSFGLFLQIVFGIGRWNFASNSSCRRCIECWN